MGRGGGDDVPRLDATHAAWLGKAVKAAPSLAKLTDADGRRAIDVAHPACKQEMQAALFLLGRYRPGPRPKPCGACITCCSFLTSCCCPCCTGCGISNCCSGRSDKEMQQMESQRKGE